ncbi:flavin reductase family protein [Sphingomonas sp. SRS2]|uniref:flavin reductase family protein n=1 Tax=Sphingomonas sp. SRS2 TaxID=133190 RepID=UPI000618475A|nr:flavin reductase family protein [Sphingomonas sp. SRS2]KKC27660.1 hypothetical protein WP12_01975 [Sphingomonas sp. SRS2]
MDFDMAALSAIQRYKLLTSTVVPRPIAWIVTQDAQAIVNVAPFSCFNLMGYTPPVVAIGIQAQDNGEAKDTRANIEANGEMVVNLVTSSDVEQMTRTAANFPPDVDEAEATGLRLTPSITVRPPRIASAPVSLECRLHSLLDVGPSQAIIIGEVLTMHIQDRYLLDSQECLVDTPALVLAGRMHGPGWYVRCDAPFPHQPTGASR